MRRAAPWTLMIIASVLYGCSTMKPRGSEHPGITEMNPNAVTREFQATATQVAQIMADVMSQDSILEQVSMTPDTKSGEYRNFSKADRQALGISQLTLANDVNYNIKAKSKNGHPVGVAIRLKGTSACEVSVLYGSAGDMELSKDLLDKADLALTRPSADPSVAKTSTAKAASSRSQTR